MLVKLRNGHGITYMYVRQHEEGPGDHNEIRLSRLASIVVTLLAKMLSRTVHATRAAAASTGKREFSALFTAVDEFPG